MENILNYPQSTIVNRIVPKTMFYRFMEVNQRMKSHFVNDVVSINWLYKLSASTLNVNDTDNMKEIEIFHAVLKTTEASNDIFTFIDTNMPHHIVFILQYGDNYMILINYKEWKDNQHQQFNITQSFTSPWVKADQLQLTVEGQSLPRIYDNFVAQVSGIGEHKAGTMNAIVKYKQAMAQIKSEIDRLEKKMNKEKQFSIQMEINKELKAKRKEIEKIQNEINKLQ